MKWEAELSGFPPLYNVYDGDGLRLAYHLTHEQATLIASAPDLLAERDALRDALKIIEQSLVPYRARDASPERAYICSRAAIEQARAALGAEETAA